MDLIVNVIWLVFGGLRLAHGPNRTAAMITATVVGVPLALANLILISVSPVPWAQKAQRLLRSDHRANRIGYPYDIE